MTGNRAVSQSTPAAPTRRPRSTRRRAGPGLRRRRGEEVRHRSPWARRREAGGMTTPDGAGEHGGAGDGGGSVRRRRAGERLSWWEDWADTPWQEEARDGWAHHGLAVLKSGRIVGFHPSRPEVLVYEPSGRCVASFPTGLSEGHGITVVEGGGDEQIWIADPGNKMRRGEDGLPRRPRRRQWAGRALRPRRHGDPAPSTPGASRLRAREVRANLDRRRRASPRWQWRHLRRRRVRAEPRAPLRADGTYLATLTGEEGPGGRFNCPHGILIDRRRDEPELLVADRGNAVVRIYGLDGHWRRDIGGSFLNSPSAFAPWGERMVVAELRARLAVLDADEQAARLPRREWRDLRTGGLAELPRRRGARHPPGAALAGQFNSPHGLASDGSGNVYVAEWLIGGRMVKLEPLAAT